jgi:hypothetical protein
MATLAELIGKVKGDAEQYKSGVSARVALGKFVENVALVLSAVGILLAGQPNIAYVSPTGSDTTGQIGTQQAFATIGGVFAAAAAGGATTSSPRVALTIYLAPGAYTTTQVVVPDIVSYLAILGQGAARETTLTGGAGLAPCMAYSASANGNLKQWRIADLSIYNGAGVSVALAIDGSASNAVLDSAPGLQVQGCNLGPTVLTRLGYARFRDTWIQTPNGAVNTLDVNEVSFASFDNVRGFGGSTLVLAFDYSNPVPATPQSGYVVNDCTVGSIVCQDQCVARIDAMTTLIGANSGADFLVLTVDTDGVHNPYVEFAGSAGTPSNASISNDANLVVKATFNNIWSADSSSHAWGLVLTNAKLYGVCQLNLPDFAAADPVQQPSRHRLGGTNVLVSGFDINGFAEGGGNHPIRSVWRNLAPAWSDTSPVIDVNGHHDFDARNCNLEPWTITFAGNGARLDADNRPFSTFAAAGGAKAIDPPFPTYVAQDYVVAIEATDKTSGPIAVTTKSSSSFTLDVTNPNGNLAILLLRPAVASLARTSRHAPHPVADRSSSEGRSSPARRRRPLRLRAKHRCGARDHRGRDHGSHGA